MRPLLSVSVLALSSLGHAEDWFRLHMSTPITFGTGDENGAPSDDDTELPPGHGQNSGDRPVITASGGMFRSLAPVSIPVLVDSGSGGYVLEDDHPDLTVVPSNVDGQFTLEGALMSSATVRLTATDMLYVPAEPIDILLSIHAPLVAHGPADLGVVRVGSPLAADVVADGAVGNIEWTLREGAGLVIDASGILRERPLQESTPSQPSRSMTSTRQRLQPILSLLSFSRTCPSRSTISWYPPMRISPLHPL